jgi:hypothetical protein
MKLVRLAKSLLRERYDRWFRNREERRILSLVSRLRLLKGKYKGQRCFIMGNGPSLNEMDLNLFEGENMWCTNRAYLLFDRVSWRPKFYTGVDRRVIPDIANELNELAEQLPDTTFFWPIVFFQDGVIRDHNRAFWFHEKTVDESRYPEAVFSEDCVDYVVHPRTVTISAIQLASYLGFNPIYLIGCDTNYVIPAATTILEEGDSHRLTSTADNDPNHFDARYFGAGKKWHAPHPEKMIEHYRCIRRFCDSKGTKIINATVGGMLEEFPRMDYREVLKSK